MIALIFSVKWKVKSSAENSRGQREGVGGLKRERNRWHSPGKLHGLGLSMMKGERVETLEGIHRE